MLMGSILHDPESCNSLLDYEYFSEAATWIGYKYIVLSTGLGTAVLCAAVPSSAVPSTAVSSTAGCVHCAAPGCEASARAEYTRSSLPAPPGHGGTLGLQVTPQPRPTEIHSVKRGPKQESY